MTRRFPILPLLSRCAFSLVPCVQAADAQDSSVSRPGAAIGDFGLDLTAASRA